MTNDEPDHSSNDFLLAGEFVVGVLPFAERAEFEARLAEEAQLRQLVRYWESRLLVLDQQTAPVQPPEDTIKTIERRLFGVTQQPHTGFPRWLSAVVFASVVILSLTLLQLQDRPVSTQPVYATTLLPHGDSDVNLVAVYEPASGQLRLSRSSGQAASMRDFELWLIEPEKAPVSLGTLPDKQQTFSIVIEQTLKSRLGGSTLAISDEPDGGSPTGAPTGDVLAAGQLIAL